VSAAWRWHAALWCACMPCCHAAASAAWLLLQVSGFYLCDCTGSQLFLLAAPPADEADWNIVKKGWEAHVLGEAPHYFKDALTAVKTLRVSCCPCKLVYGRPSAANLRSLRSRCCGGYWSFWCAAVRQLILCVSTVNQAQKEGSDKPFSYQWLGASCLISSCNQFRLL